MKTSAIIILLSLAFLEQMAAQPCSETWEKSTKAFDLNERLALLDKYISAGCSDSLAIAFLHKGKIFNELDDTVSANVNFKKAVAANPELSEGWLLLAFSTYFSDPTSSICLFYADNAINSNPSDWYNWMIRGDIMVARKEFQNALLDYEKSMGLINEHPEKDYKSQKLTYVAMAGTLIDLFHATPELTDKAKYLARASECLDHAIKIDSLYDKAYFMQGNVEFHKKQYLKSIASYETCYQLNPNHPLVIGNLAIVHREAGQYYGEKMNDLAQALNHLEKSYELNQQDSETLRLLGVANGIKGDHEKALHWFTQASKVAPHDPSIWWNLSKVYGATGNKKQMAKCRKKALELDPDIEKSQH